MKNLKVSKKLLAAFGTILLLLTIIVITSVINLDAVSDQMEIFYIGPYQNTKK